jgi:cell division protein FtsL
MSVTRRVLPALIATIGIISFVLIAWLGYELGRYRAGYALFDVRREAEGRDASIADQAARIEDLERQIAILETAREIDAQSYFEVEANLDQLEAQIVEQQERLRFYQGIVSPEDGEAGLRIQDFEVVSRAGGEGYIVTVLLVQAIVHNEQLTGSVELTLSGSDGGEPVVLELSEPVSYAFRYFQSIEFPLTLPPGFVAESVDVTVVPKNPRDAGLVQSFDWPG